MGSIDLQNLVPGKTYSVVVRARDDEGNQSPNSVVYTFTVPSTKLDGTQLVSINNAVVTAFAQNSSSVVGGALTAGGLDTAGTQFAGKAQLADVWNSTASAIAAMTGSANTGAVVINSTGILGYQFYTSSSGIANFFLNTTDGNAYFRGTVYAGAGNIGGFTLNNTSLYSASTSNNYLSAYDSSFEDGLFGIYWKGSVSGNNAGTNLFLDYAGGSTGASPVYNNNFLYFSITTTAGQTYTSPSLTMQNKISANTRWTASALGVSAGTYTFSAYSTNTDPGLTFPITSSIVIKAYNVATGGTASIVGSGTVSIPSANSWQRNSAYFTLNSASYYEFVVTDNSSRTPGTQTTSTIAIDAVQLESGNTVNSYTQDHSIFIDTSPTASLALKIYENNSIVSYIDSAGRISSRNNIPYYITASSYSTVSNIAANASVTVTLTLPTNFIRTPVITITPTATNGHLISTISSISGNPGFYQFSVRLYNPGGVTATNYGFYYTAVQMSSTSGTG